MTVIDFLESPEVKGIADSYKLVQEQKQLNAWNIFNLSSYNNHLENFHSDIIASLLAPNGLHGEGDKFLMKFIEFLNVEHSLAIEKEHYCDVAVAREQGRLDIWIKDEKEKHCIIIENKINNANDMDEQIVRYHALAHKQGFQVDAIIYLSLDGLKRAPNSETPISVLRNVATQSLQRGDLVSGWLQPIMDLSVSYDSSSLIHQYIKLITHINQNTMEQTSNEQFYQLMNDKTSVENLNTAIELYAKLNTYRRDEFQKKVGDFSPFMNIVTLGSYGNRGTLFQNYRSDGANFKLDIYFLDDGIATIRFWTPEEDNKKGLSKVKAKLEQIGLANDFEVERPFEGNSMMRISFTPDQYKDMIGVDAAVLEYTNKVMKLLRGLPKSL